MYHNLAPTPFQNIGKLIFVSTSVSVDSFILWIAENYYFHRYFEFVFCRSFDTCLSKFYAFLNI